MKMTVNKNKNNLNKKLYQKVSDNDDTKTTKKIQI
jgi:hypothetical protein